MASSVSVRRVATEGYLVPANLEVALSPDFLQPGRAPDHALAFVNAIRTIVLPPLIDDESELELVVADSLDEMLTAPILTDLEELTTGSTRSRGPCSTPRDSPRSRPRKSPRAPDSAADLGGSAAGGSAARIASVSTGTVSDRCQPRRRTRSAAGRPPRRAGWVRGSPAASRARRRT